MLLFLGTKMVQSGRPYSAADTILSLLDAAAMYMCIKTLRYNRQHNMTAGATAVVIYKFAATVRLVHLLNGLKVDGC